MSESLNKIKKYQVPLFFLVTLVLSWAVWVPATITKLGGATSAFGPEGFIGGIARWSPGIVAILLMLLIMGKTGVGKLLYPIRIWRVSAFWYLFAVLFQVAVFLVGKMIDTLLGNTYEVISPLTSVYGAQAAIMIPITILFAFPGAFAEELGWRGFALPRLQSKASAFVSSIVIALVWGIWHIPLIIYFEAIKINDIVGIILAVVNFIPVAIIYTWIYNNSKGSLLLVTLFHVGQQLSNNLLGELPTSTDAIIVWLIAVGILVVTRLESFSRKHPKQQYAG